MPGIASYVTDLNSVKRKFYIKNIFIALKFITIINILIIYIGRILNRFSKDTGTVDEALPSFLFDGIDVFSMSLAGLLTIRSCDARRLAARTFDQRQDGHTRPHFHSVMRSPRLFASGLRP